MNAIRKNFLETALVVAPVFIIVLLLQWAFAPMSQEMILKYLIGTAMVIIGLALFSQGVNAGLAPVGSRIGSSITRTGKLWVVVISAFVIGFMVTVAEPDVQVLADTVTTASDGVVGGSALILFVSIGVGVMVVLALLRILFQWSYALILCIGYALVFILTIFAPAHFIPIAFDSGGVTTGPMTVPFILALGVGVAAVRGDSKAEDDSFGLVGIASLGPILGVLLMGVISR